jgi:hypothetical protein
VKADQVEEILLSAIDAVNEHRMEDDGPDYETMPLDLTVLISGTETDLDSLDLIVFIESVEGALRSDGYDLDLSAFLDMNTDETSETLRDYILDRLA